MVSSTAEEILRTPMSREEYVDQMTRVMQLFVEPGQVVELRALGVQSKYGQPHVEAGFFDSDHLHEMAETAMRVMTTAKGVYFTLNPLNPALLARRCNRIDRAGQGELSSDKDVVKRKWILIDVDPVRDAFVSATEAEKVAAWNTAGAVRDYLQGEKWPRPIVADSGNGYHLFYRIDLPADDGGLVERILRALATRFDNPHVKVDKTVFNPARICKMPGTAARKGDNTPTRPHRLAKILELPTAS
jgi:hypothetical protein